jgi:3-oxoacyl-[acyl-carrier protein] reductase
VLKGEVAREEIVGRPIDPGLEGKRVLITGASRGIGAAVARLFAEAGARLALHYRREPAEAAAIPAALLLQADFADRSKPARIVEDATRALGGLDILINNAGHMLGRTALAEMDDAAIDRVFDLNARSVVTASRAALPALRASRGSIINVGSISARTGGSAGSALYSASKAFVSTFTRALATELAPDGIRVNAVSPGTIMTEFHEIYSTPEKLEATRTRIPLERLGEGDDCAGAFLFLASERLGGYVTGQIIEVNGGQLMP